ncbi:MAG: DUF5681 domain-containing protein [Rhizorhabdus sp.]
MSDDAAPPRKGCGFPPDEHKYKPGQSGNPKGRPVGSRNKAKRGAEAGLTRNENVALEEGRRIIKTADGSEMATVSGLHRARNIAAMKWHRLATKDSLADIQKAEEKLDKQKIELFETALEMKRVGRETLDALKRHGVKTPDVCPHPDDIIIDYNTLEVFFDGPIFEEQKRVFDTVVKQMDKLLKSILQLRRKVEADASDESAQYWLIVYTNFYHEKNGHLPARYQKRLPLWPAARDLPWPASWVDRWSREMSDLT